MSAPDDPSLGAFAEVRRPPGSPGTRALVKAAPEEEPAAESSAAAARSGGLPFDPWRMAAAIWRHWLWIVLGGVLMAGAGLALGLSRFHDSYTASTSLIRQDLPNAFQSGEFGEPYKPKQLTMGTLVSVMRSPAVLAKAAAGVKPPISPAALGDKITVTTERNTDVIRIAYQGARSAEDSAAVLARYAEAVIQLTRDLQSQEAETINRILKQQMIALDSDLITSTQALLAFSREARLIDAEKETEAYLRQLGDLSLKYETERIEYESLDVKIRALEAELGSNSPLALKLEEARQELSNRLMRYTEANPVVVEQRTRVEVLEAQIAEAAKRPLGSAGPGSTNAGTALYVELVRLRGEKESQARELEEFLKVRQSLQSKLEVLPEKGLQFIRLQSRRQALEKARSLLASRQREAQLYTDNAPGYYRMISAPTEQDVAAKKSLPKVLLVTIALGVMGALGTLGLVALRELLDDRLKTAHDLGRTLKMPVLVRIPNLEPLSVAQRQQWLFRTWTDLLRQLTRPPDGPLVVGIVAGSPGQGASTLVFLLATAAFQRGHHVIALTDRPALPGEIHPPIAATLLQAILDEPHALFAGIDPAIASLQSLSDPAPGTWSAPRRRQWAAALQAWRAVPSLVVVLEVPVGADPETLLLAETLPNILWVGAPSEESLPDYPQLETMRRAGCHFVGAAFNQRPHPTLRFALPGWMQKWSALFVALACLPLGTHAAPPAGGGPGFREKFTLGAGDTLNFRLFGHNDADLKDAPIGPDGKISFLEAHNVQAEGKTIDEVREAVDAQLAKYYRSPRTIVTPASIHSKRYYIMGKVVDKGSYELDRAMTLVEAVARARGLETGLFERNTVELADLPRSFIVRRGRRLPVDFVRLFQNADLSQNVFLEPEDYIYFASANVNEVYLLGAVRSPGLVGITQNMTITSLVTLRGGLAERAYLDKVIVIRGSLENPKKIVVNLRKVLKGQALDFLLQPKDIIFVSDKPLAELEALANLAVRTFLQAATSGWASTNVGPILQAPIVPSIR